MVKVAVDVGMVTDFGFGVEERQGTALFVNGFASRMTREPANRSAAALDSPRRPVKKSFATPPGRHRREGCHPAGAERLSGSTLPCWWLPTRHAPGSRHSLAPLTRAG